MVSRQLKASTAAVKLSTRTSLENIVAFWHILFGVGLAGSDIRDADGFGPCTPSTCTHSKRAERGKYCRAPLWVVSIAGSLGADVSALFGEAAAGGRPRDEIPLPLWVD